MASGKWQFSFSVVTARRHRCAQVSAPTAAPRAQPREAMARGRTGGSCRVGTQAPARHRGLFPGRSTPGARGTGWLVFPGLETAARQCAAERRAGPPRSRCRGGRHLPRTAIVARQPCGPLGRNVYSHWTDIGRPSVQTAHAGRGRDRGMANGEEQKRGTRLPVLPRIG